MNQRMHLCFVWWRKYPPEKINKWWEMHHCTQQTMQSLRHIFFRRYFHQKTKDKSILSHLTIMIYFVSMAFEFSDVSVSRRSYFFFFILLRNHPILSTNRKVWYGYHHNKCTSSEIYSRCEELWVSNNEQCKDIRLK
jgi:hypothetical protein